MKSPPSYPNPALRRWRFDESVEQPYPWYRFCRMGCQVLISAFWKLRVFNRHYEPATGSVLYVSNHQSYFDPMVIGLALRRPVNYMARDSLFRFPLFKQLIESVYTFPVRRGTGDMAALKEAMRRLKRGGQLALFAEGTRTSDGRIGPLLPGMALLARRAAQWTVPVVIDGAFEAWPRSQALPGGGSIIVQYAPPIPQQVANEMPAKQFVEHVRRIMIDTQADVRRRLGRPTLNYD